MDSSLGIFQGKLTFIWKIYQKAIFKAVTSLQIFRTQTLLGAFKIS